MVFASDIPQRLGVIRLAMNFPTSSTRPKEGYILLPALVLLMDEGIVDIKLVRKLLSKFSFKPYLLGEAPVDGIWNYTLPVSII